VDDRVAWPETVDLFGDAAHFSHAGQIADDRRSRTRNAAFRLAGALLASRV
jgi:hypothetical protein